MPLPVAFTLSLLALISGTTSLRNDWQDYARCQGCKLFAESFEKGAKDTSTGNFGGGDSSWEEKNLGSYANSEIRLVEIQEALCEDLEDEGQRNSCLSFNENYEKDIEEWWYKKRKQFPNVFRYLCVERLDLCRCKPGYRQLGGSCVDVDECSFEDKNDCDENEYCSNTEGGYVCNNCDRSCDGCFSKEAEGCKKCAKGYAFRRGLCLKETNELRNDFVYVAVFWIVFIGMYFLKKGYALATAIAGIFFCIYASFPDYVYQLPITVHDEEVYE